MSSFPDEIKRYPLNKLYEILDGYFIKDHTGRDFLKTYKEEDRPKILQFISKWLKPSASSYRSDSPIQAIRNGEGFTSEAIRGEDIISQIFGDKIEVSSDIVNDFANYPMRRAFIRDPWDLLQGYVSSEDKNKYFKFITGVEPVKFLNNTEKIFYLTRGYGRPNHYISTKNLQLRSFYNNAEPTALLALMDFFGMCPTNQNPDIIREKLSDINLLLINRFHVDAVSKITACLQNGSPCDTQGCDPKKVECFKNFLKSIGMLSTYEYDPRTGAFISNLSQLELYKRVIPSRKWNYEEIASQPNPYIVGILYTLPDDELLSIAVPYGLRLIDQISLTFLGERLRSKLLANAVQFLTEKKYFMVSDNEVLYGQLSDRDMQKMKVDDLVRTIHISGMLIDNYDNVISPQNIQVLNDRIQNIKIQDIINKTIERKNQNNNLIRSMSKEQRDELHKNFSDLSKRDFALKKLQVLIENSPPEVSKLILWTFQGEWIPVALYFSEYFESWQPRFTNIIADTLDYYMQVLKF